MNLLNISLLEPKRQIPVSMPRVSLSFLFLNSLPSVINSLWSICDDVYCLTFYLGLYRHYSRWSWCPNTIIILLQGLSLLHCYSLALEYGYCLSFLKSIFDRRRFLPGLRRDDCEMYQINSSVMKNSEEGTADGISILRRKFFFLPLVIWLQYLLHFLHQQTD